MKRNKKNVGPEKSRHAINQAAYRQREKERKQGLVTVSQQIRELEDTVKLCAQYGHDEAIMILQLGRNNVLEAYRKYWEQKLNEVKPSNRKKRSKKQDAR